MSEPHKNPPRRIEPAELVPTLIALAKLAARAHTPTIDIVIHDSFLSWRDHNKTRVKIPTIETFQTKHLICRTMTFATHTKVTNVRSAIEAHNRNLEN